MTYQIIQRTQIMNALISLIMFLSHVLFCDRHLLVFQNRTLTQLDSGVRSTLTPFHLVAQMFPLLRIIVCATSLYQLLFSVPLKVQQWQFSQFSLSSKLLLSGQPSKKFYQINFSIDFLKGMADHLSITTRVIAIVGAAEVSQPLILTAGMILI